MPNSGAPVRGQYLSSTLCAVLVVLVACKPQADIDSPPVVCDWTGEDAYLAIQGSECNSSCYGRDDAAIDFCMDEMQSAWDTSYAPMESGLREVVCFDGCEVDGCLEDLAKQQADCDGNPELSGACDRVFRRLEYCGDAPYGNW